MRFGGGGRERLAGGARRLRRRGVEGTRALDLIAAAVSCGRLCGVNAARHGAGGARPSRPQRRAHARGASNYSDGSARSGPLRPRRARSGAGSTRAGRPRFATWGSEAFAGGADDDLDDGGGVGAVEAVDDLAVEGRGVGGALGVGEEVAGGFPGLEDFPFFGGVALRDAGVEGDGVIEAAFGGADVGEAAKGLGAEVGVGGMFAEELLVAGGGLGEEFLASRAGGFGGGKVEFFGDSIEEGLGGGRGVGGGGSGGGRGCGGLGWLGGFGGGTGGEQEQEDGEDEGQREGAPGVA